MKRTLNFILLALLTFSSNLFPIDLKIETKQDKDLKNDSPTYIVKKTTEDVREILNNEKNELTLQKKIREAVGNFFNYSLLSELSLDNNWKHKKKNLFYLLKKC
jgi:hypothetical protein